MKQLLNKSLHSQRILKSTLIVMVVTIFGYLFSFFSQILVAQHFGTSKEADAFVAAKIIPDVLYGMVTVIFTTVFIMCFSKYMHHKKKSHTIAQNMFNIALLSGIVGMVLLIIFAPMLAKMVAPGFDAKRILITTQLIRILSVSVLLLSLISLMTGILYSYHEFLFSSLLKVFLPLGIMMGILFLSGTLGIKSLAVGTVIGVGLTIIFQGYTLYKKGFSYQWHFNLKDKVFLHMLKLSWPLLISSLFFYVNRTVNTMFASLLPSGKVAVLNYAFMIVSTPAILFSGSITTTTYPIFTRLQVKNDHESLERVFHKTVRWIVLLLVPMSLVFIFLGKFMIRILFERGAFTAANTVEVNEALVFYSIGLVAMGLQAALFNLLHSKKKVKLVMILMIVMFISNVGFNALFIDRLGYRGLALAMSLAYWVNVGIGWVMVKEG